MAYKYGDWTLYCMDVDFKVIGKRKVYFFAKKKPKRGTPCDMPEGYEVIINKKTGMPLFTSLSGRGTVSDEHPLCFEGAVAVRPGCGFAAYIETDLIIILGSRICLYYLFGDIFNHRLSRW